MSPNSLKSFAELCRGKQTDASYEQIIGIDERSTRDHGGGVADLIECNEALIARTKQELEQMLTDAATETYPSVAKVAEMLEVDKSTLWRWAKCGYLVPIDVGGKRRYRMSDVRAILEGGRR